MSSRGHRATIEAPRVAEATTRKRDRPASQPGTDPEIESRGASPFQNDGAGFDAHLGPWSGRYFGSGYRRVHHILGALTVAPQAERLVELTGSGSVEYPVDWSKSSDGESRQPHLSTIDAIVLSVHLAEAFLRSVDNLTEAEIAHAWLAEVEIKAGATPNDRLDTIPLHCKRTSRDPFGAGCESAFKVRVGSMSVAMRVRHRVPADSEEADGTRPLDGSVSAGTTQEGPLTGLYRDTIHLSSIDLSGAGESESLRARHEILPVRSRGFSGLESAYWPGATIVDALVLASQMAQVLIFTAPGVSRATVSNLWMRHARFTATAPPGRTGTDDTALRIVKKRSFDRGSDGSLHSVDVQCPNLFGVVATASLAFVLPAAAASSLRLPVSTSE